MKIKLFALTVFICIIAACSSDADEPYCFVRTAAGITAVSGNTTVAVNKPLVFNVTFKTGNNCGEFDAFSETSGFPKNIAAMINYEGCYCGTGESLTEEYTFTPTATGTYELRFLTNNPESPAITKTVTVTAE